MISRSLLASVRSVGVGTIAADSSTVIGVPSARSRHDSTCGIDRSARRRASSPSRPAIGGNAPPFERASASCLSTYPKS